MVLQQKFLDKEACETMGRSFMKFEMNKYFTFKVQCIEDLSKETWQSHKFLLYPNLEPSGFVSEPQCWGS